MIWAVLGVMAVPAYATLGLLATMLSQQRQEIRQAEERLTTRMDAGLGRLDDRLDRLQERVVTHTDFARLEQRMATQTDLARLEERMTASMSRLEERLSAEFRGLSERLNAAGA